MKVNSNSSKLYFTAEPKNNNNFSPSMPSSKQRSSCNSDKKTKKLSLADKIQIASLIVAIPSVAVYLIGIIPQLIMFMAGKENKFTEFVDKVRKHSRNLTVGFGAISLSTVLYRKLEDAINSKNKKHRKELS